MVVANRGTQGKARQPGKQGTFRACTARKGVCHERRLFISDIFILQFRAENRVENQQKTSDSGIFTLGVYVCGLASGFLCPDPLYFGYGDETDFF